MGYPREPLVPSRRRTAGSGNEIARSAVKRARVRGLSTDLNYWIKHPFEFSDPILKPEYL